jgi:hypothetical protein
MTSMRFLSTCHHGNHLFDCRALREALRMAVVSGEKDVI